MINNILLTRDNLLFQDPMQFNLVFGNPGSMPATAPALAAFRSFVPAGSQWGVTHLGRDNWTFLAAAIAMGASLVRIGFEDSAYLDHAATATENCQLVDRLVRLIRAMGLEPAAPSEARRILKLQGV